MTNASRARPSIEAEDEPTSPARSASPVREVLAIRSFRYYWLSQFLSHLVAGTIRFTFIWLVLEISDWPAGPGAIALAAGLPALFLSLHAGVWSDRSDRRLLVIRGSLAAAAALGLTSLVILDGPISVPATMVLATLVGVTLAVFTPAIQAIVPMLVPHERLMNAIAIQNIAMQIAMFAGALVGGAAIASFGIGGAFALLAGLTLASALAMLPVRLPASANVEVASRSSMAEIRAGLHFTFRQDPLRSLMLVTVLMSASFGVMMINLPEFAKETLGKGPLASSALFGAFAPGMLIASLFLAFHAKARGQGMKLALAMGLGLGTGQLLLGMSASYPVAFGIMLVWGLCCGVAMTTQRSLVQSLTPNRMMGRVMGILTLTIAGTFPLSALFSALVSEYLGPGGTMVLTGAITLAIAPLLVFRKAIRNA